MSSKPSATLLGLTFQELSRIVADAGEPPFRARQLFHGLYAERVESIDDLTTLPMDFREALKAEGLGVGLPKIENKFVSSDGTVRYLLSFADGQSVETVWMPEGDGGEAGTGAKPGRKKKRRSSRQEAATGGELRFAFPVKWAARWIVSFA